MRAARGPGFEVPELMTKLVTVAYECNFRNGHQIGDPWVGQPCIIGKPIIIRKIGQGQTVSRKPEVNDTRGTTFKADLASILMCTHTNKQIQMNIHANDCVNKYFKSSR